MFDFFEKHSGFVKIILALIALGLIIGFGLSGYQSFREPYLANVGGVSITEQDLLEASGGQKLSQAQQSHLLNQLIQRQLALHKADELHFGVSKQVLQYVISNIPSFIENGKFNAQRYQQVLASQKKTPQQYERELAREIKVQHLLQPLVESSISSHTSLKKVAALLLEKREIKLAQFMPQTVLPYIKINSEQIQQHYAQNKKLFELPEQARVEYILLDQAKLAEQIVISDQEVLQYQQAQQPDMTQEERQARHILLAVPKDTNANTKAEIKNKAITILNQARSNPKQFSRLAQQYSQDMGSAQQGGELGFFKRETMVPAFSDAVFRLKKGEISDLVETPFGFHIIQLEDIRNLSATLSKEAVVNILKKQKSAQQFFALQNQLNEALTLATDLKPIAAKFHLDLHLSQWISQAVAKDPILNHTNFKTAIFNNDVLNKGYITDLIELHPGLMVAARVIEKKPAMQQSLEQVRSTIQAKLEMEAAINKVRQIGNKALADLRKGQSANLTWTNGQVINRLSPGEHAHIVSDIFKISAKQLPYYVGTNTPHGYCIYQVSQVIAPSSRDQIDQSNIQLSLLDFYGQLSAISYLQNLYKNIPVKIGALAK